MSDVTQEIQNSRRNFKLRVFQTGCLCASYFAVVSFRYCFAFYIKFHSNQALSLGVLGPSLMDLGIQVGSTAEELSSVFVVRGVLAIAGSLIGPGLDRINLYLVIVFSLLVDAVLHGVVPWLTSLTGVLCTLGPPELFNCAIGMGKCGFSLRMAPKWIVFQQRTCCVCKSGTTKLGRIYNS